MADGCVAFGTAKFITQFRQTTLDLEPYQMIQSAKVIDETIGRRHAALRVWPPSFIAPSLIYSRVSA